MHITDANIYVTDASVLGTPSKELAIPGVVYINGEKIHYYEIDYENNVLTQIRRAVDGTGGANVHVNGSSVVESSLTQLIPGQIQGDNYAHQITWLNANSALAPSFVVTSGNLQIQDTDIPPNDWVTSVAGNVQLLDGTGLEGSNTIQARFIRGAVRYEL